MSAAFVHLHLHSEYSLADSTIRVDRLVKRCVELGQPAVAITDLDNVFAAVKFYKAAEARGIKPIIGADVALADGNEAATRMTLLCRDRTGYLTLSRLLTRAWMEGHRTEGVALRPDWLREDNAGLFALAGRASLAGRLVASHRHELAEAWLADWAGVFGDRLHLELVRARRDGEDAFNAFALYAAARRGIPVVASNDVRFLHADEFEAHEARVCIATGRVLDDPKRPREYSPEQYLKSTPEMAALFADVPDAIDNAVLLAKRCNVELKLGQYALPAFPVPSEHTIESWLRNQAREGLAQRLEKHPLAPGKTREDYDARLETELDVIIKMGFPGYFLIVADFINWAKQHGIPVGPGRGSGAGSLVAWALGITDLDPLPYDLLFERFLNPERVSMPDFDIDFCMDRRDEVIEYVARKYGRDRVSQIITYGTMAAKAVVRDAGRVLGFPYGLVDGVAKLIPNILGVSLKDAMGEGSSEAASQELIDRYRDEDDVRDLIDLARQLEDLTRNAGKHAGGVVIAPTALTDFVPLYCEEGGAGVVTQFDKDDVESVGLVKFDFLGLRTLTIIDWAVKAINKSRAETSPPSGPAGHLPPQAGEGKTLDITAIPLDDPRVFALFQNAQTAAVFQFEGGGMQRLLKEAKPDRFEDLIALNALYRPGPMDLIPSFVARKHGREAVTYPDPRVEPILKETYGIMVYQEQVMQMAQIVGGYTLGGADLLRRAMGKKIAAEMAKHRVVFGEGASKNGVSEHKADAIFDLMEKFAGYGFNKSHAAAYSLVAYQTAWLKVHYPAQFMAAVLSSDMDNTDKVVVFLNEARALGLTVQPPDVNASGYMFEATDAKTIRYGLGAIKGVGRNAVENVVQARSGAFVDLADFCQRVDGQKVNKRVLEALILSGAMDALGTNRASLMAQLPECLRAAEQAARDAEAGQNDMFGAASATPAPRLKLADVSEWPPEQRLAGERDTLGHYLSGHPTLLWRDTLTQLATCPIGEIGQRYQPPKPRADDDGNRFRRPPETQWVVAGQLADLRKRGTDQAFVQLEDWSGRIEVSLFREAFVEFAPLLTRDAILVVEGGLAWDDFAGALRLRARRVLTLNEACERQAKLLRIKCNGIGADFLPALHATLAGYRGGQTPLRVQYANTAGSAEIELGPEWRVRATADLKRSLDAMPGVKSTDWVLGRAGSA